MRTSVAALLAALSLSAVACGTSSAPAAATLRPTTATPAVARAAAVATTAALPASGPVADGTYVVWVDNNRPDPYPSTYEYFFPDTLTVHPGTVVDFRVDWYSGEPHNVAVGRTVDGAREALDALPPQDMTLAPGADLPVSKELQAKFAKMPQVMPPDKATTAETMRLLQPCYVEQGDPPLGAPCGPDQRTSDKPFDGSQSFISSQVLFRDGDHFRLPIAASTPPGRYTYLCTLHPSYMYGTLNVVALDQPADTPSVVAGRGQAAIDALNARYRPIGDRVIAQTGTRVEAGGLGEGGKRPEITINVFPPLIRAKVGETVTWNSVGAHMWTFNLPPEAKPFVILEEVQGVVQPVAWAPDQPGPGQPSMPSMPELGLRILLKQPATLDGGTVRPGQYVHSGLLFGSLGPLPPTYYSLKFAEPGKYVYTCMRHPGMVGTVSVE